MIYYKHKKEIFRQKDPTIEKKILFFFRGCELKKEEAQILKTKIGGYLEM
jgi:hypothetical protein